MSLSARRGKAAGAKARAKLRSAARSHRFQERQFGRCVMQSPDGLRCPRPAERPGGYCQTCWDAARKGHRA